MEVYVDNRMIKTKVTMDHVSDLEEVFHILRGYEIHLNMKKCVLGVTLGKFLGYLISSCGIKANLNRIVTLVNMRSPKCFKEIQQLNGLIVALSHFISKCMKKGLI